MNDLASILLSAKNALLLAVLFYLPGLSWAWVLRPQSRIETAGIALGIGFPALLLPAIFLAECGYFSAPIIWTWAAVLTMCGLLFGRGQGPRKGFTGFIAFCIGLTTVFVLPQRGEWIAGGWDPGVNVNQGLLLARTGAFIQPPDPSLAAALHDAPEAFTRDSFGLTEVFPGIPVNPENGALRPYFYRVTPTLVALIDLVAGRAAALRVNHLAGLFALTLFAVLLLTSGLSHSAAAFGLIAFALQPIFLAHTSNPASEMLELAIVCATGMLLCKRERFAPWCLALLLALGAINRASFLFHQSILLLILAVWELREHERRDVTIRHLAVAISLLFGLAWYTWVTPDAWVKIRHLWPALLKLAGSAVVATLFVDGWRLKDRRALPVWTRNLAFVVPMALLARECFRHAPWEEFIRNVPAWFAYATPALALLGLLGFILFGRKTILAPWLIWLFTALLAVWLHRHATELYPWATKRWLGFSPPLLATGLALLVHAPDKARRPIRIITLVAAALTLLSALPLARTAWRSTDYDGATSALDTLAGSLNQNDVVVSDHFLWGTPLSLAYGFTALNAEPLLAGRGDPAQAAHILATTGRRIVLVSSTRRALNAWPAIFQTAQALDKPIAMQTHTRIQHRKQRGFDLQESDFMFQAFLWEPVP